jgi:hypothetical protein
VLAKKLSTYYDYFFSRQFLNRICSNPPKGIADFCNLDHDSGLYIFTYVHPATATDHIPLPFLLVDLSDVPETAFPEFIESFKEQVKRQDMSDSECLNTFRLTALKHIMRISENIGPLGEEAENRLEKFFHMSSEAAEHEIDRLRK